MNGSMLTVGEMVGDPPQEHVLNSVITTGTLASAAARTPAEFQLVYEGTVICHGVLDIFVVRVEKEGVTHTSSVSEVRGDVSVTSCGARTEIVGIADEEVRPGWIRERHWRTVAN